MRAHAFAAMLCLLRRRVQKAARAFANAASARSSKYAMSRRGCGSRYIPSRISEFLRADGGCASFIADAAAENRRRMESPCAMQGHEARNDDQCARLGWHGRGAG